MNRPSKTILIGLTLILALAWMTATASACPTCKDGMAGDPAYSNMVTGYFWSILFMMSMPFLIFTGLAAYFYYEIRRARRRQLETASANVSTKASREPDVALQS